MIPYGKQSIDQQDIDAVVDVLKSDFLTQGPKVPLFENALCNYTNAKHAVAVNSATSALHIACKALGLSKGDILWTTPITFVASANCGLYCGAIVDFIDISPKTYNLCTEALEKKLNVAKQENKLPKIVIAVHLSGQSCDMQEIYSLSEKYNFKIIEDASHAIGGKYQDNVIGNCKFSDITVFSFHPVKIITTAEGGAALTNQPAIAEKMRLLMSHGITRNTNQMSREPDGPWYYEQIDLGYNYRMTELQAALGISQLTKIDTWVSTRHKLANIYNKQLKELAIQTPFQSTDCYSSFHLYIIRLTKNTSQKKVIFKKLKDAGISVNLHYIPIYKHQFYQELGFDSTYCDEAEKYYKEAISLPLYPALKENEQSYIVKKLKECLV